MADAIRWAAPSGGAEWGIVRNGDKPWVLYCGLPGIKRSVEVESIEAGQVRAEGQLRTFLRMIRADFVDDDGELIRRNADRGASDA